jgi:hypothetical protein
MHGDVFAEDVVITDDEFCAFTTVFQILRWKPYRAKREEAAALADPCRALNNHVFVHSATGA